MVNGVDAGSPAARAGLETGDVITKFNGQTLENGNALRNLVASSAPGSKATITVVRGGQSKDITVELERLEPRASASRSTGEEGGDSAVGMTVQYGLRALGLTTDAPITVARAVGLALAILIVGILWVRVRDHAGPTLVRAAGIAFAAVTRLEVDAFHRAAMESGGVDNGAPGLRPHYHPDERYVLVLRGTWYTDEGKVFRPKETVPLTPGDFMRHPKDGPHYDGALDEDTWVAISGYGPTNATVIDGGDLFGRSR